MESSPANLSLVAVIGLCSYLCYLCALSPNPRPKKLYGKDRIRLFTVDTKATEAFMAILLLSIWILQSALILFPERRSEFCLNPEALDENLLSWSRDTLTFTVLTILGATIRLMAYAHLGTNFTFRLAKPKGIISTGVYRYMQHPSYTGVYLLNMAFCFVFWRADGVGACFLPSWIVDTSGINIMGWVLEALAVCAVFVTRVRDEEEMLRKEFGKEWLEYHQRTARFIPWIF